MTWLRRDLILAGLLPPPAEGSPAGQPMRVTPPNPGFSPRLLAAAANLSFLPTLRDASGEFGAIVDKHGTIQHLTLQSGGPDGTWTLVENLPEDFGHFLLTRETFEILYKGTLMQDGTIEFGGLRYYLRAAINGGRLTAKAVPVDTDAA